MNIGNSVSRVGGAAQVKAMKSVVGSLKIDLAQFRDLEAFATFGSELDKASQAQLDRGYRLIELLKQGHNEPMPVEEEIIVIYAGANGFTDTIKVDDVRRFEAVLRADFHTVHPEMLEHIRATGTLPDVAAFEAAIRDVVTGFADEPDGGAAPLLPEPGPADGADGAAMPAGPQD
jgi:F-type H+-transporting ATPase subunit alpha